MAIEITKELLRVNETLTRTLEQVNALAYATSKLADRILAMERRLDAFEERVESVFASRDMAEPR